MSPLEVLELVARLATVLGVDVARAIERACALSPTLRATVPDPAAMIRAARDARMSSAPNVDDETLARLEELQKKGKQP